jgi:hypothetical protein
MLLVFLALLLPLPAQQRPTPPPHQRPAPPAAAPKLSDPQLEALIRAKFAKSKINADKFTVRVQGGIATLEGRTDIIQHKGVATRLARAAGATVNNRIQIGDAAREKAAANLEKGRRRVQIERGEPRSDAAPTRRK